MDFESDRERQILKFGYRSCWLGFCVYGFAMLFSSLVSVGDLVLLFSQHPGGVARALGIEDFNFYHYSLRAWTRVLATYFLFVAWQEPSWRSRSGLLFLMSMIDLGLWGLDLAVRDGYFAEADSHPVLRASIASVLGWSRFGLIANIVGTFANHGGNRQLESFSKTAQATSVLGFTIWFFYFLEQVDWARPWPLRIRPMNQDLMLFFLVSWVVTTICLIQASYLCLVSSRDAARVLRGMKAEDAGHNPWDDSFR